MADLEGDSYLWIEVGVLPTGDIGQANTGGLLQRGYESWQTVPRNEPVDDELAHSRALTPM